MTYLSQKIVFIHENKLILPLMSGVAFLVIYYPALSSLVTFWYESEDYSHAFITVPVIGYIVYKRKELLAVVDDRLFPIGLVMLCASLSIYLLAIYTGLRTTSFLMLIATLFSLMVCFYNLATLKKYLFPFLLLLSLIPLPSYITSMATLSLQLEISKISQWIVQWLAVPVYREGNVIFIPQKAMQVAEACSGMRSLLSLITLGALLGHFALTSKAAKIILVLSAIPIAILVNILRVVLLILFFHYFGIDLGEGSIHTIFGIMIFLISLTFLFATQRMLSLWLDTRK